MTSGGDCLHHSMSRFMFCSRTLSVAGASDTITSYMPCVMSLRISTTSPDSPRTFWFTVTKRSALVILSVMRSTFSAVHAPCTLAMTSWPRRDMERR